MFKSTFSKIKKACAIALVPRIIRSDGRYTTKKFGKSSINVLRTAEKSTNSGCNDGEADCDKCKRFIDFVFGPSKPKTNPHVNKTTITNIKGNVTPSPVKVECKNEKNDRLIKDYFGVDEDVVRQDVIPKNLLRTSAVDKQTLSQSYNNLDAVRNIISSQPKKDAKSDHKLNSGTRNEDFKNNSRTGGYERTRSNPRDKEVPVYPSTTNYKVQSTTAKENEEKLEQKIEDIEEKPHVEASVSKVQELTIPPKVLGDRFVNFSNNNKSKSKFDYQETLDQMASKCLNTPADQIDNKLIREMEKSEIPRTQAHPQQKCLIDEDEQIDILEKPEKPLHEVEIDLDNREFKRERARCAEGEKLSPSFEMPPHLDQGAATTKYLTDSACYDKMEKKEESTFEAETATNAAAITIQAYITNDVDIYDSSPRPPFDINKPLIDPYDKRTLAFGHYELEEAVMDSKLLDDQRIGKPSQNEGSRDATFDEGYVALTKEISVPGLQTCKSMTAKDAMSHSPVQAVYHGAPRELNWRPFPSFEAREEVIDFYSERDQSLDPLGYTNIESMIHEPTEPETQLEKSCEPQTNHIYTSTSVPPESKEQISHSFVQPEQMINPLVDKAVMKASDESEVLEEQDETVEKNLPEAFEPLPSLNPDANIPLTELLRRVRMRNRLEYCREFALHTLNVHSPETLPVEGKCGKKPPRCPPLPPKCPPPNPCKSRPPPPCPPPPAANPCNPKCPRPCPPPKKNPCNKFKKKCDGPSIREVLTLLAQSNPQLKVPQKYLLPVIAYKAIDIPKPVADDGILVNENLVFRLSVLGKILLFHCTEAIDATLPKNRSELSFARDFEPWTPIPSWPIPKKEVKRPFVCPKEGCRGIPPPKLNAPCKENPCLNFPKRSNFSLTDLFSFSLVESLLYKTA